MSDQPKHLTSDELAIWRTEISRMNQNNIFCHCRDCNYEWVDSVEGVSCPKCVSHQVESIICWQFPDD